MSFLILLNLLLEHLLSLFALCPPLSAFPLSSLLVLSGLGKDSPHLTQAGFNLLDTPLGFTAVSLPPLRRLVTALPGCVEFGLSGLGANPLSLDLFPEFEYLLLGGSFLLLAAGLFAGQFVQRHF